MEKHPGGRPRKNLAGNISEDPVNGIYYTIQEACKALGVHRNTLQKRLKDGTIKGKKINGVWKIYKDSLKE